MERINAWQLAFVYAGCFLGAGYVSGQEMWQFFGAFGIGGVWGLALCTVLQAVFGIILFSLVRRGGVREIEQVVVRRGHRYLRTAIGSAQLLLLCGVTVIMSAGVGALTAQMVGKGAILASLLFCSAVAAVALRGVRGLIAVFSAVVPLLIGATLVLSALTVTRLGRDASHLPPPTHGAGSPLLSHWAVAAVSFVSYNLFGSIAVLVPVAGRVRDRRTARRGAILAALFLFAVACAILISLYLSPESVTQELPMLALARTLHPTAGWCFALLLLAAMFGTALSCLVASREYLMQKYPLAARHPITVLLLLSALAFVGGLFGFGTLIGWIYPIFGYLGFAVLCSVTAHERYVRRAEKRKEKP